MIITVTERGTFKRCRRMWDFASFNRQSLTPVSNKVALTLGSLVHEALAEWMENPEIDPQAALIKFADAHIAQLSADYRERIGAPISKVELDPVMDAISLAHNMVGNYQLKWGSPLPEGYKLIAPEQTCVVPIPNTNHWECKEGHIFERWNGADEDKPCPGCGSAVTWQPIYLEGTLDGFVADDDDNLYVLERKTYGNRPKLDKLQMEDQFLAYVWILQQLFKEHGNDVVGILYDGLWKRDNKPLDECFMRHIITRPPEELEEFEQHLTAEALDMINPRIYLNRRWEGCFDCGFEKLCTALSRGEDWEYVRDTYYRQRPRNSRTQIEEAD